MTDLLSFIPSNVPKVGAFGLLLIFGAGLAKNWFYTRGQVMDILASKAEVIQSKVELVEIWKEIAKENQSTIKLQAEQINSLVSQTESILTIVRELQSRPTKQLGCDP